MESAFRRPVEARHFPPIVAAPTIEAKPPPMVYCARCETPAVLFAASKCSPGGLGSPDSALPQGWLLLHGHPYCVDCSRVVAPAARVSRLKVIGPQDGVTRHRGCRIGHQIVLHAVGIRIHGGANPPEGSRDEPAQFLLELTDLNDLMTELSVIRLELQANIRAQEG